jgi:SAM-dependent methyltransferase
VTARFRANRLQWDEKAEIHACGNAQYPVRRMLAGKSGWSAPIPDDLGSIRGKTMLHLQCHIGLDTFRWAKQGARITGVDFSPRAIQEARRLSEASGIPARFVLSDVYALRNVVKERFDIVVSTYGVTCWLPDLGKWAAVIAQSLKTGGFFYLAEIHPFYNTLEFDGPRKAPRLANSYFACGAVRCVFRRGTYAVPSARRRPRVEYGWQHSLHETVDALLRAGLTLEYLHEFPYAYANFMLWTRRRLMRRDRRGFWHFTSGDRYPLLFSLKARR